MNRTIFSPAQVLQDTDLGTMQRNAMIALGAVAQAAFGTGTVVDGLACTPTSPASMVVNVGPGSIISLATIDATAFGSLLSDSNPLVKVGINSEGVTPFTLTAPGSSGQSINYLIEATLQETDTGSTVLEYFNPSNPTQPFSGPANDGVAQNTQRNQIVELQLKAGTAANTGTQTTPAVDSNWVGLYVIQVNFGATTVTSGNITTLAAAPFIPAKLGPGFLPGFSHSQTFSTSGTFTVPAGVTVVRATVIAGGSGGAGSSATFFAGPCGGGGGAAVKLCSVTPGQTIAVTVGAGGAGSAAAVASGAGGSSSFGAFCSATGAAAAATGGGGQSGGPPGSGTGGDRNFAGGFGSDGQGPFVTNLGTWPGQSGSSIYGGSGRAGQGGGAAGPTPGAGGGGSYYNGTSSTNGGAGAAGQVFVEW